MDKLGLEKARKRLGRAIKAFDQVQKASCWDEFEPAWTDFLLASNSVFSVIEQSIKNIPSAQYWWGTRKNERRHDPLLSYMHHARNSDEHGIDPIAQDLPCLSGPAEEDGHLVSVKVVDFIPVSAIFRAVSGKEKTLFLEPPGPNLIRVSDSRFGDHFDPPETHLGLPIKRGDPYETGAAFLKYVGRLISDAEEHITKSP